MSVSQLRATICSCRRGHCNRDVVLGREAQDRLETRCQACHQLQQNAQLGRGSSEDCELPKFLAGGLLTSLLVF